MAKVLYDAWYLTEGAFDPHSVIHGQEKLAQALAMGYAGMRASGTPVWRHEQGWWDVRAYEQDLDKVIAQQRVIVLCTWPVSSDLVVKNAVLSSPQNSPANPSERPAVPDRGVASSLCKAYTTTPE